MFTRHAVAEKITQYLQHQISLVEIVDWAEQAMMDEEFDEDDYEIIRDVVSRLGFADVRAFGLTWEDCQSFLNRLGYQAQVEVHPVV